jgi:hypothetical protein
MRRLLIFILTTALFATTAHAAWEKTAKVKGKMPGYPDSEYEIYSKNSVNDGYPNNDQNAITEEDLQKMHIESQLQKNRSNADNFLMNLSGSLEAQEKNRQQRIKQHDIEIDLYQKLRHNGYSHQQAVAVATGEKDLKQVGPPKD